MGRHRTFDNQDILDRATELFWRNGFNATSMRDLMQATGLAKASLYNAFGNKDDLFQAVLQNYIEGRQSRNLAFLENQPTGRAALEAYFDNILRNTSENRSTPGCLIVNTAAEQGTGNEPIRSIVEKGIERTERHLARTIARGVEDGSIRADVDPDTAALCISATLLGIRVLARAGASTDKIAKLIRSNLECHAPKP